MHDVRCYNCRDLHNLTDEEYYLLEESKVYHCPDCDNKCSYCGHLLGDEIGYHSACKLTVDCGCRYTYGILRGQQEPHPDEPGSSIGVYLIPCVTHELND